MKPFEEMQHSKKIYPPFQKVKCVMLMAMMIKKSTNSNYIRNAETTVKELTKTRLS
jgi:hypothetical protein